jgi:hypothetical protein
MYVSILVSASVREYGSHGDLESGARSQVASWWSWKIWLILGTLYNLLVAGKDTPSCNLTYNLWAEDHFIVGASLTAVHLTAGVWGVRDCFGTGVSEFYGSRRGAPCIWAIDVIAAVARSSCQSVRWLAEAVQVVDRAARGSARSSWTLYRGCWGDLYREVVRILQALKYMI